MLRNSDTEYVTVDRLNYENTPSQFKWISWNKGCEMNVHIYEQRYSHLSWETYETSESYVV